MQTDRLPNLFFCSFKLFPHPAPVIIAKKFHPVSNRAIGEKNKQEKQGQKHKAKRMLLEIISGGLYVSFRKSRGKACHAAPYFSDELAETTHLLWRLEIFQKNNNPPNRNDSIRDEKPEQADPPGDVFCRAA